MGAYIILLTFVQREFKRGIGELVTSGCTGGSLFLHATFRWLDATRPEEFIILWDEITLPQMLPFATWIVNGVSAEVAMENQWWTYTSGTTRVDVTCPEWWDVTETDMRVSFSIALIVPPTHPAQCYFPEQMVPKAYLTECDSLTEMAAVMLQSMRRLLQEKFHF